MSQEWFSEEALDITKKDGWTFSIIHFSPLSPQATAPDILWNLILPEHNRQKKRQQSPTQHLGKALGIVVQLGNVQVLLHHGIMALSHQIFAFTLVSPYTSHQFHLVCWRETPKAETFATEEWEQMSANWVQPSYLPSLSLSFSKEVAGGLPEGLWDDVEKKPQDSLWSITYISTNLSSEFIFQWTPELNSLKKRAKLQGKIVGPYTS